MLFNMMILVKSHRFDFFKIIFKKIIRNKKNAVLHGCQKIVSKDVQVVLTNELNLHIIFITKFVGKIYC